MQFSWDEIKLLKQCSKRYIDRLQNYLKDVDLKREMEKRGFLVGNIKDPFLGELYREVIGRVSIINNTILTYLDSGPGEGIDLSPSQEMVEVLKEALAQYGEDLAEIQKYILTGLKGRIDQEKGKVHDLLGKLEASR